MFIENKMCAFFPKITHPKRIQRGGNINMHTSSGEVPVIFARF